jgi:hypothetical protein
MAYVPENSTLHIHYSESIMFHMISLFFFYSLFKYWELNKQYTMKTKQYISYSLFIITHAILIKNIISDKSWRVNSVLESKE